MNELLETIGRQSQEEPVSDAMNPLLFDASWQSQEQAMAAEATNVDSKERQSTSDIFFHVWFWLGYTFWVSIVVFTVWRLAR
jgi:hypothetical protein